MQDYIILHYQQCSIQQNSYLSVSDQYEPLLTHWQITIDVGTTQYMPYYPLRYRLGTVTWSGDQFNRLVATNQLMDWPLPYKECIARFEKKRGPQIEHAMCMWPARLKCTRNSSASEEYLLLYRDLHDIGSTIGTKNHNTKTYSNVCIGQVGNHIRVGDHIIYWVGKGVCMVDTDTLH